MPVSRLDSSNSNTTNVGQWFVRLQRVSTVFHSLRRMRSVRIAGFIIIEAAATLEPMKAPKPRFKVTMKRIRHT
jgi:hypothetical protein